MNARQPGSEESRSRATAAKSVERVLGDARSSRIEAASLVLRVIESIMKSKQCMSMQPTEGCTSAARLIGGSSAPDPTRARPRTSAAKQPSALDDVTPRCTARQSSMPGGATAGPKSNTAQQGGSDALTDLACSFTESRKALFVGWKKRFCANGALRSRFSSTANGSIRGSI